MTIEELILILEKKTNCGYEITKRKGLLTSTWEIYRRNNFFYYFDVSEQKVFDKIHRYTRDELLEEFKNSYFEIDFEFEIL